MINPGLFCEDIILQSKTDLGTDILNNPTIGYSDGLTIKAQVIHNGDSSLQGYDNHRQKGQYTIKCRDYTQTVGGSEINIDTRFRWNDKVLSVVKWKRKDRFLTIECNSI